MDQQKQCHCSCDHHCRNDTWICSLLCTFRSKSIAKNFLAKGHSNPLAGTTYKSDNVCNAATIRRQVKDLVPDFHGECTKNQLHFTYTTAYRKTQCGYTIYCVIFFSAYNMRVIRITAPQLRFARSQCSAYMHKWQWRITFGQSNMLSSSTS